MKLKLAIIYGVIAWILIYFISNLFSPLLVDDAPYVNLTIPLSIIIVITFFGILYIRNFNENEVMEGLQVGIVFLIVDMLCDMIFLILPRHMSIIFGSYPTHLLSMIVLIPLITTFLGYLAHMKIELI